jgi:signal transduction histidine kinase
MLVLSSRENKIFVEALSQSAIRAQLHHLKTGEYREFIETLSFEFPQLHFSILKQDKEIFRFNRQDLLSTCKTTVLDNLKIKICKPLLTSLSVLIPLCFCFVLLIFGIITLALRLEKRSKGALQNFMKEAGLLLKEDMSFTETLQRLQTLKTEFIILKKKMSHANEQNAKSKIAAHLAHDLRSPLLVFQEALCVQNEKEFNTLRPRLFESISRVQFMINTLNDKDIRSIQKMEVHHFHLQGVIHEAKIHARKKKIKFITQIEEGRTYVLDKYKIERAVANLLHNAIYFCNNMVILRMCSKGDLLFFTVSDDGSGVPEEFEELIYKEHFTFGKDQGTGLGLSYAKSIARSHNGSLRHYSKQNLTVFEMTIPIKPSEETQTLATILPIKKQKFSQVLVSIENLELRNRIYKEALESNWVFTSEDLKDEHLKAFKVVYSDIPEWISQATRHGLRAIVAMNEDTFKKVYLKITRLLETL